MANLGNWKIYYYSIGVLGFNLATILLGIIYLIVQGKSVFWDFCGWFFLVSWAGAITLPLLVSHFVDLHTPRGKQINRLGYITFVVSGLVMLCMFWVSFLLSGMTSNAFSEIGGLLIVLYGCFFGSTALNTLFAFFMLKQSKITLNSASPPHGEKRNATNTKGTGLPDVRKFSFVYIGILLIYTVAMGGMIYFALLLLAGTHLRAYVFPNGGMINGLMGLISGTFG